MNGSEKARRGSDPKGGKVGIEIDMIASGWRRERRREGRRERGRKDREVYQGRDGSWERDREAQAQVRKGG